MKYFSKIVLSIIGMVFMLNFYGCSGNIKYERYSGKNPGIDFSIDHISGWQVVERIGSFNSYIQVSFYEPVMKGKGLRAGMAVTIEDSGKVAVTPKTIEGMSADLIKRRMLFDSSKVLSKTERKVAGAEAIDIELSYKTSSDPARMGSLVFYRESVIIFERDGKFYTMRYGDFADNFDKYSKAFDHIVKSIKFK